MTPEQLVKQKYPKAVAESYKQNGPFGKRYWIVWENFQHQRRLGEGETKVKAYRDAKIILTAIK